MNEFTEIELQPPNRPWEQIELGSEDLATMTFYYSDFNSPLIPIRDVSHRNDAKRDPNIETLTYGLFSHCCKNERKRIVERGIRTQFFCTTRANGTRVLTGYYCPKYYFEVDMLNDYAIAASDARFVSPGFVLNDLVDYLEGYPINRFFRTWKYIRGKRVIDRLRLLINTAPDATDEYLSEINRLELQALEKFGNMYQDRIEPLSWNYARELMEARGIL